MDARRANVRAVSPPLLVLPFVALFGLATGSRSIDPSVPTSVPAPAGVEVTDPVTPVPESDDDQTDTPQRGTRTDTPRPAAPAAKRTPVEPKPSEQGKPRRRGGLVMASIGAAGCAQDQCEALEAMPWFGLTGGYRFGRFAPILTVQGGAIGTESTFLFESADMIVAVPSKDVRSFVNIGAGTLLHLLASTRFDPYFGLTLGFLQTRVRSRVRGDLVDGSTFAIESDERVNRGTLGIVLGLGFRIRERWTLGPRVDVLVPFAGKACTRFDDGDAVCTKIDDIESVDPGQFFPRPWAAMLQLGAFI